MVTIYLGLGSNIGDREKNINSAVFELEQNNVKIQLLSSIIETDPVGGPPQGKFFNAVLQGNTDLPPLCLLRLTKSIEKKIGRIETVVNGPRIIDIDILLYGDYNISNDDLIIPHPRMLTRKFVMQPLKEIAPKFAMKLMQKNCGSIYSASSMVDA